ncbi:hypothetical protein GeomeDRAFT_1548 [Geobacter metallireducens RCH3]|uniref:Uncharacterized protein n=1 Tax=Geobacter metallireducens (strain ATCC 53774 / DSM 7210 / GS-15) TaxID=269799 RepID=Q39U23_GEOMG|nr:GNAT family N-acetyltransferase [Geobacter metallireducens]ABB32251.1 hypothetical protein Gmet_2022 [Geobacter metallireducens GS-15]EHP86981.1 hypothetical protein GeomeDRAFT_1548 [Geobacter metallireducens RCH3]
MKRTLDYTFTTNYADHRQNIHSFWERINGHRNERFFDSFYAGNPAGESYLGLCYDGERLVGQENYIPQDVACAGTLYRSAMGVNTLVDPDYRLFHGVFGKLCRLTTDELEQKVDLLFAYANEESKKYYLKYFNWKITAKVGVYKKITNASGLNAESVLSFVKPGRRHADLSLNLVSRFSPEQLDPVLERYRRASKHAYFHKTAAFLNWKFLGNLHYQTTGYQIMAGDRVCGYCVTYDTGSERKILDIIVEGDDPELFRKAISHLARLASEQGIQRLVIYATPDAWYEPLLRKMVFLKRWDIDFLTHAFTDNLPDKGWVVHCGDFDMF